MSWPTGYERILLDEVDSTMAQARRIAPTMTAPTWICALRQTAAKGRRGRAWVNPEGNFSATLAMRPTGGPADAALRSFVAALALFDTFVALTGRAEALSLKWPNDVLLNGGKVAGILLESSGGGPAGSVLSIGIGINLVTAPIAAEVETRALRPVSLLSETGVSLTAEEVLNQLATDFARYEAQFATYGFPPIRAAWLDRAARLGQVITARTGTSETTGTFETVDEQGQIVIKTAKGRVAIPAADVFF